MASVSLPVPPTVTAPTLARRAWRRLGNLLLAIAFVIALFMACSKLVGFNRYVITGKSMTGSINIGSIVYDRTVPTSSLKVGDVITYVPPKSSGVRHLVTHRIIWVGHDSHGRRIYRTKGDNNPAADPWNKFTLGREVPKVVFHVPYVGYALTSLSQPKARMVLIGLPAILIALAVLAGLWEDAGREAKREGAGGLEGAT
jgi:signal peptidase I